MNSSFKLNLDENKVGNNVSFPIGYQLIEEGQRSENIYYIISGVVRIYTLNEDGQEITLSVRGPGEMIGLYSFLTDSKHEANAITLSSIKLLEFDKDELMNLLNNSADFNFNLLSYLAYQLRQENKYLRRLLTDDLESRTWKSIRRIARFSPNNKVALSQDEISRIVGATRAKVTKSLHKIEQKGKIKISRKKITVV